MSLLSRLFRPKPDPREGLRPLWHRTVEIARERGWYADHGVADSVAGRFDMITAVLAMVLLRMEREPILLKHSAHLTELFVDDMDGQLRESGVGDVVVGKHIGRLMSVLGGRLGAYRDGLAAMASGSEADLAQAVARNVSLTEGAAPGDVAGALAMLAAQLGMLEAEALLDGIIPR
jgi:cytochrome b pre-mRNA-processing protein 3